MGESATRDVAAPGTFISAGETPEQALEAVVSPPLTTIVAMGNPDVQLPDCLRGRYDDDAFFALVLANPDHYANFEVHDGLIYLRDSFRRILCIPDVSVGSRRIHEIIISHAHSILAHLGSRKTLYYLKENVWWKLMVDDVRAFCDSCGLCATSKPANQRPYGLLHPLPVPSYPWEVIGVDFVGPLPELKNRHGGFDMITVIIDHFSGMVHLVPSRQTYRAKDVAELAFDHIYKLHGLPRAIVSNRDSLFTSVFWDRLHALIGTELRMSSSFHPQSDGMTERANRTMEQMLRQCIAPNQKDWVTRLPGIEFAMNAARSETTGFSPFFLNSGRTPRPMIWDPKSDYPGVRVFAQRMKDTVLAAHDTIIYACVKQTVQANKRRRAAPFALGDLVYLSTQNLRLSKNRARKLMPKYIGPYKILHDFENSTYKLDLPSDLRARGIHSNFHASLLRIHRPNDDRRFPGQLLSQVTELGGTEDEWTVEKIIAHSGKGTTAQFEMVWRGGDKTWAPYADVSHLDALRSYFEALGISKLAELPAGKAHPSTDSEVFVGAILLGQQVYNDGPTKLRGPHSTLRQLCCYAAMPVNSPFTPAQVALCEQHAAAINDGSDAQAPPCYRAWFLWTHEEARRDPAGFPRLPPPPRDFYGRLPSAVERPAPPTAADAITELTMRQAELQSQMLARVIDSHPGLRTTSLQGSTRPPRTQCGGPHHRARGWNRSWHHPAPTRDYRPHRRPPPRRPRYDDRCIHQPYDNRRIHRDRSPSVPRDGRRNASAGPSTRVYVHVADTPEQVAATIALSDSDFDMDDAVQRMPMPIAGFATPVSVVPETVAAHTPDTAAVPAPVVHDAPAAVPAVQTEGADATTSGSTTADMPSTPVAGPSSAQHNDSPLDAMMASSLRLTTEEHGGAMETVHDFFVAAATPDDTLPFAAADFSALFASMGNCTGN